MKKSPRKITLSSTRSDEFISHIVGDLLHPKCLESVGNAVKALIRAGSAAVTLIGAALASLHETKSKNAIKQVDRLLSNPGFDVGAMFHRWVPYIVGSRQEMVVAIDWTDYDHDDQTTICANAITSHGRASPLVWKTVRKSTLKGKRNGYEDEIIRRLTETVPMGVKVTIIADRGFGDTKLYRHLDNIGYQFIIRSRGNIYVRNVDGDCRQARDWVASNGRARKLDNVLLTAEDYQAKAVITKKADGMKDIWILVTNMDSISAQQACKIYGRRFTVEETFRDLKDPHFGFGLRQQKIGRLDRRDRMIFILALAHAMLTVLGAAGESIGIDMDYKVNTVKARVHSLFRQGMMYFRDLDRVVWKPREALLLKFEALLQEHELAGLVTTIL